MSQGYASRLWKCPFFRWDERQAVHCEGGTRLAFESRGTYVRYINAYCDNLDGWWDCTIACALCAQYEREDKKIESDKKADGADHSGSQK